MPIRTTTVARCYRKQMDQPGLPGARSGDGIILPGVSPNTATPPTPQKIVIPSPARRRDCPPRANLRKFASSQVRTKSSRLRWGGLSRKHTAPAFIDHPRCTMSFVDHRSPVDDTQAVRRRWSPPLFPFPCFLGLLGQSRAGFYFSARSEKLSAAKAIARAQVASSLLRTS